MPHQPASTALDHIKVLDLTRVRSGPTCVRQLADWGADVIKIEMPASLEADGALGAGRATADFQNLHRNKRSLTLNLKDDDEFLQRYLACLRQTVVVDINDFEIVERRARFGKLLVGLKSAIWKLLRFYTFRLWSQQNQVNTMLLAALDVTENRFRDRILKLEARIAELEQAAAPPTDGSADADA